MYKALTVEIFELERRDRTQYNRERSAARAYDYLAHAYIEIASHEDGTVQRACIQEARAAKELANEAEARAKELAVMYRNLDGSLPEGWEI